MKHYLPRASVARLLALLLASTACQRKSEPVEEKSAQQTAACCQQAGAKESALAQEKKAAPPIAPEAGSASPGAPKLGLVLVGEGPELLTDIEFVPGRPRWFAATGQAGKAELFELPAEGAPGLAAGRGTLLEVAVHREYEMGLLSVVFHPQYAENGRLFVHYNPKGLQLTRIAEYALPAAELGKRQATEQRVLLEVKQPFENHNGGELAFGPDGKLYLGLGDGGSRGDPQENGERLDTLLGKILRLEVDGERLAPSDNPFVDRPGARPEIFAYGLRNPWKISFDPEGRLVVADVGQNAYEEIDLVGRGENLGWNTREAAHCFDPKQGCPSEGRVEPIFEYGRDLGQSVTGGFVVTSERISALHGRYVFGDFLSKRLWAITLPSGPQQPVRADVLGVFEAAPGTFGRDATGELYVSDYGSGRIFRFAAL